MYKQANSCTNELKMYKRDDSCTNEISVDIDRSFESFLADLNIMRGPVVVMKLDSNLLVGVYTDKVYS